MCQDWMQIIRKGVVLDVVVVVLATRCKMMVEIVNLDNTIFITSN